MKREKSGAVRWSTASLKAARKSFCLSNTGTALIGHSPKGHMEEGESEVQTALREVKEETGLDIDLEDDFRQSVEYYPKPNVKKQVVYFLGHARNDHVVRQEEEIGETRWHPPSAWLSPGSPSAMAKT